MGDARNYPQRRGDADEVPDSRAKPVEWVASHSSRCSHRSCGVRWQLHQRRWTGFRRPAGRRDRAVHRGRCRARARVLRSLPGGRSRDQQQRRGRGAPGEGPAVRHAWRTSGRGACGPPQEARQPHPGGGGRRDHRRRRERRAAQLKATPDVILTEALGSAGTYLKEVKTQNGGKMIPFIGSSATIDPVWFQQVRDAIGIDDLLKYYAGVDLGYTFSGPAYAEFLTNLNAAATQFADAPKYKQRGSTLHLYDGIIMTALAMVATNSADRTVYNPKIIQIANGSSGATVVNTYKDGVAAIKAGKTIRFVGAGGENNFDQYNNSQSGYILVGYDKDGNEVQVGQLTPDQTAKLIAAGG